MESTQNPLISLIPFLMISCCLAFVSWALAKEKGRNVILWTVLGLIPIVNWFCMLLFIGAANLRLEKKFDEILDTLRQNSRD